MFKRLCLILTTATLLGCSNSSSNTKSDPSTGNPPDKGASSEQPVKSGTGSIQWDTATWAQDAKEPVLQLTFTKDSDWKACNCADGEYLALLVAYVQNGSPGSAAKLTTQSIATEGGTVLQSVVKPGGGLDFIFMGGNIATNNDKLEGAVIRISHSDQLKPEALVKSQSISLRLAAELYASTAKFEGKGRIAFLLQRVAKGDKQASQLSNVIELPVEFAPVKKRDE